MKKKFEPVFEPPESFSHAMNRFEELSTLYDRLSDLVMDTPGFSLLFGEYYDESREVAAIEKMKEQTEAHMEYLKDYLLINREKPILL